MKRVKQRFWVVTGDIGECLLCGERPTSVGFFMPEFPAEFHLLPGQALAYLLCDPCWKEGREDYIEAAIRGDIDQSRYTVDAPIGAPEVAPNSKQKAGHDR